METPHESGPQLPTRNEVLEAFSKYGGSAQESADTLSLWILGQGMEADVSENKYSRLQVNMNIAELFLDAHLPIHAQESCDAAWDIMDNTLPPETERMSGELKKIYDELWDLNDKIEEALKKQTEADR